MSQQAVLLDVTSRFLGYFFTSMFQVLHRVSDFWSHEITNFLKIYSVLDNLYFSVNRFYKEKIKNRGYFLIFWYILMYRNVYTQTHTHGRKLELEIIWKRYSLWYSSSATRQSVRGNIWYISAMYFSSSTESNWLETFSSFRKGLIIIT